MVPVIDLSRPDRAHVHAAIDAACRRWGVFQLIGHGIDVRLLAALRRQMRALFGAAQEERQVLARTACSPWRAIELAVSRPAQQRKEVYDFRPADGVAPPLHAPAKLPAFEPIVRAYHAECGALAKRVLRVMARNLGMPANALDVRFRPAGASLLRLSHYPHSEGSEQCLWIDAHTDAGALTLLLQDQAGLEVFHRGGWVMVDPLRDALVVTIGEVLQAWSGERYRAPVQRVLANLGSDRFSAPFFLTETR